eukprot:CAMPEP_0171112986 /NCGR_PEP_ID=MMETSP0766_2-20121228/80942_1 /TAXON_ID=439317 /ORGANISM="Gambierdiscus australes, Strain CAWD 149" /LENGTH=42 /DNA_ID= /DNA_START= /DNA_END= /DNA_ORIENTATION=
MKDSPEKCGLPSAEEHTSDQGRDTIAGRACQGPVTESLEEEK